MNKVILIGRLTKDVELRYTTNNLAIGTTSIAVNRQKDKDGNQVADFINLVSLGKTAETLSKYCFKGSLLAVEGRIQTRNYEDANGNKHYVTEVVIQNIQFLENKKKKENKTEVTPYNMQTNKEQEKNSFEEFAEEIQYSEEELPF